MYCCAAVKTNTIKCKCCTRPSHLQCLRHTYNDTDDEEREDGIQNSKKQLRKRKATDESETESKTFVCKLCRRYKLTNALELID